MTTNYQEGGTNNRNKVALAVLGVLALVVGVRALLGLRSQPQMGPSDEVFKAVDALFTAVTARDEKRLGDCEQRLERYKEAGKLNNSAWKRLAGVITQARAGRWEPAAHKLYDFMQGQRREGFEEQPQRPKLTGSPSGRYTVLRPKY